MEKSYIPKTSRQNAKRRFYVFFNMNCPYEGKFAIVEASSAQKAQFIAWDKYGSQNICTLNPNEEYALNKIKLYGLKEVSE